MAQLDQIIALTDGASFYRGDLHIHSFGNSHDVKDQAMTPSAIVAKAIGESLSIIAITDHNEISGVSDALQSASGTGLTVIPGVELPPPTGICCATSHRFNYFNNSMAALTSQTKAPQTPGVRLGFWNVSTWQARSADSASWRTLMALRALRSRYRGMLHIRLTS
jgi:PHP domain